MTELLMGIDVGTSACKTAVFDYEGRVLASASRMYPVEHPQPGWAQQDPQLWWEAVCEALKELAEKADLRGLRGIGICGQSGSAVAVDKKGRVLSPTPIWMDTRSRALCEEAETKIGAEALFSVSGNPLKPSYSLPKLLWYKKHLPKVYEEAHSILQSNGFIAFRLTGALSQDKSQGYGYSFYDIRRETWDEPLMERLGIRPGLLPLIVDCHSVVGHVTKEAAKSCGLSEGIPVVAGGLDAACGTLGAGVIHPGETQEQGGQAGGMSIATEHCQGDPRLILSSHVVPGLWLLQGGTVGGGGVMNWFEREFGAPERAEAGNSSFRLLDEKAAKIPPGCEGLVFLPYMAGERSPIWDPEAKGVYFGIDYSKTKAHLARAAMEGAAFALKHNLDTAEDAGASVGEMRAMGGAAGSSLWTQMKADITGKTILVPDANTATALGAAILAGIGTGVYKSFEEAVEKTVKIRHRYVPDPERQSIYMKNYRLYLELYKSLKPLMRKEGQNL